jgi:hypothetical protein
MDVPPGKSEHFHALFWAIQCKKTYTIVRSQLALARCRAASPTPLNCCKGAN